MERLTDIVIRRLGDKGVAPQIVPGFIRSVALVMWVAGQPDLHQINQQLDLLGWGNVELDYHTLQLIIASLENEGVTEPGLKPACWFMSIYGPKTRELESMHAEDIGG